DLGNTVIVVEHDDETMMASDYLVDFGPGAGVHGGNIIAKGTPEEIVKDPKSITGQYLSGKKKVGQKIDKGRPKIEIKEKEPQFLTIRNISEHNVKNIDVEIPLGKF